MYGLANFVGTILAMLWFACVSSFTARASDVDMNIITDYAWHTCNSCTLVQASTTASQLGRGQHYVYNLSGNVLYLFDVECEPVGGGSQCYAESILPASDAQALFNDYHLVFQQINSAVISSTAITSWEAEIRPVRMDLRKMTGTSTLLTLCTPAISTMHYAFICKPRRYIRVMSERFSAFSPMCPTK